MADLNPYQASEPPPAASLRTARPRISAAGWFCVAYYGIALMWGARSAIAAEKSAGGLVFQLALAVCLGTWAIVDARQRQRPIPRSQRIWFFVLAGLVVPGYVIVTRGWRGVGWVLLHTTVWFVVFTATVIFVRVLLFQAGWQ